eukprot:3484796-Alexandrium_andersonii.AAC.1
MPVLCSAPSSLSSPPTRPARHLSRKPGGFMFQWSGAAMAAAATARSALCPPCALGIHSGSTRLAGLGARTAVFKAC